MNRIIIKFAEKCAWRATYVYWGNPADRWSLTKVAHVSVDPNNGTRPTLSGSFGRLAFRLPLPWISWAFAMRYERFGALALYRVVHGFWFRVDGRFGKEV